MRLFRLHIITERERLELIASTAQKAEAITVEACARHLEAVRDQTPSELARRVLDLSASSLRKLKNVNA